MELTGKVIIFKNKNEANLWFEYIQQVKKHAEIESAIHDFESWKEMQERFKNEAPTD